MADFKNFAAEILGTSTSQRGLTDPIPEPVEEVVQVTPEIAEMIDALYNILMVRLDKIESLLNKISGEDE